MQCPVTRPLWQAALVAAALAAPAFAVAQQPLALDPTGATKARLGYFPIQVQVSSARPAGVTKEPSYRATPQYGTFHLGNGPRSEYIFALDEPANGDWRVYLDTKQDGDLTACGDGSWSSKKAAGSRTLYGVNHYILRASWGTPNRETSYGEYGIAVYRWSNIPALLMYREAAREGTVKVDRKPYAATLVENDCDALYNKPLDDQGKVATGGAETRPVWLMISIDPKHTTMVDARQPFMLLGRARVANVSDDGSRLSIVPTNRKVPVAPKQAPAPPLLAAGAPAPAFQAIARDGNMVGPANFRGKVLVVDFWASWCGPCQQSMPHLQHIFEATQGKDIAILGVCVWDDRSAYDAWVKENATKYTFPVAFDPAGRAPDGKGIGALYHVSGIPTTYVIDPDGKVITAIVGYEDGDHRLEDALKKAGIEVASK